MSAMALLSNCTQNKSTCFLQSTVNYYFNRSLEFYLIDITLFILQITTFVMYF
jgi:hypothetical protein